MTVGVIVGTVPEGDCPLKESLTDAGNESLTYPRYAGRVKFSMRTGLNAGCGPSILTAQARSGAMVVNKKDHTVIIAVITLNGPFLREKTLDPQADTLTSLVYI